MDIYKRIAYLNQMQSLLNDIDKSKQNEERNSNMTRTDSTNKNATKLSKTSDTKQHSSSGRSFIKLNSFFGHISKEIGMKHNVQM